MPTHTIASARSPMPLSLTSPRVGRENPFQHPRRSTMRLLLCLSPKRWALLLAFLALPFAIGCGKKTGTVSGTVNIDGTPLKGGNVTLARNDGHTTMSGIIDENGSYKIENVP